MVPRFSEMEIGRDRFWIVCIFLSVELKGVSAFPAYWTLRNVHSIKQMANLLLKLSMCNVVYSYNVFSNFELY